MFIAYQVGIFNGLFSPFLQTQGVLHPKTVAGNLPLITSRRNHESLLERFRIVRLELDGTRHLNQVGRLTANGVVNDRLGVQGVDDMLTGRKLLEVLLDLLVADRFVAVPSQQAGVQVETRHLLKVFCYKLKFHNSMQPFSFNIKIRL